MVPAMEPVIYDGLTGETQVKLSANCHGFLQPPAIRTNGSPFVVMEYFHSTLLWVGATLKPYLLDNILKFVIDWEATNTPYMRALPFITINNV